LVIPAEHWRHLRITSPIESTFATVRLSTVKTKGRGSRVACLTMVFKLMESASKSWRSLNGSPHHRAVIAGTKCIDEVEINDASLIRLYSHYCVVLLCLEGR